ncbi:ankyrin-3-like [Mytilus trossulus]|uniref:ankyrin-3-like n=1 Tax=Mytilus trossulus TaxID=6551 RepID=UPI0030054C6F
MSREDLKSDIHDLLEAIWKDSLKDVKDFIAKGVDVNRAAIIEYEDFMPPLSLACQRGNFEIAKFLFENGADLSIPGSDGKTALHYVCEGDEHREEKKGELFKILKYLVDHGANIDIKDNMGCTPLFTACEVDDINMVRLLIQSKCDINVNTVNGYSAMKVACRNAKFWSYWHGRALCNTATKVDPNEFPPIQITKMLLQANANMTDATLLPTAVQFGDPNLVRELIGLGMDVNMLDDNMCTPLGSACTSVSVKCDVVKLLLSLGADVNKGGGWKKQKPLIFAYVHNSVDKIRILLSYGAKVTPEEMTELVSLSFSKSILENPEVIGPNSKELLSWQLLLAAGFRPMVNGTQLEEKVFQLQMCSSYDKICPWITSLLFPMLSLKEHCRLAIRNSIPTSIDSHLDGLFLPKHLRDFLSFQEYSSVENR